MDPITIVFVVAAIVLIGSEFVAPSLVGVFLGVSAVVVAALRALGVVESVPMSVLMWAIVSFGLTLPLRPLVRRVLPGGEVRRDRTDLDDNRDAMGEIVEVIDDVDDESEQGRIRFQGTSWQARSTQGRIEKGTRAQLVYRDKMVWVVEPVVAPAAERALFDVDAARTHEGPHKAEATAEALPSTDGTDGDARRRG